MKKIVEKAKLNFMHSTKMSKGSTPRNGKRSLTELAKPTASSSALPKCPQKIVATGCIVNCRI